MELTINHNLTFFEKPPYSLEEIVIQFTSGQILGVAVALNFAVIPKNQWADTALANHDNVLIITASQGG